MPIRIGVSSCLIGQHVRYDADHKLDHYITDILGKFMELVPVCPEVECGLPTPREPMHLEGDPQAPRLVTVHTGVDLTEQMLTYASEKVQKLEKENLCGFIFKSKSPSSGLFRVKVYRQGVACGTGRGLFADAVVSKFHLLPVEEEVRLADPVLRENFIERIFAYKRWKEFLAGEPSLCGLIEFHADHKLLLLAHHEKSYRELGKLVAHGNDLEWKELLARYEELFMFALRYQATVKKNVNVLMHMIGYFKKVLTRWEKEELLQVINQYADSLLPLVVPLTLLKHYVGKYNEPYLKRQVYLNPRPAELMLRNHV